MPQVFSGHGTSMIWKHKTLALKPPWQRLERPPTEAEAPTMLEITELPYAKAIEVGGESFTRLV